MKCERNLAFFLGIFLDRGHVTIMGVYFFGGPAAGRADVTRITLYAVERYARGAFGGAGKYCCGGILALANPLLTC
jgi:hypothetical protein